MVHNNDLHTVHFIYVLINWFLDESIFLGHFSHLFGPPQLIPNKSLQHRSFVISPSSIGSSLHHPW